MLFAQYGGTTSGRSQGGGGDEFIFLAIYGVVLLVLLVIEIFYLMTMSNALSLCSPRNRRMEPSQVWMNFIPLFNLYWMFVVTSRVSESLKDEFYDRRLPEDTDYGKGLGTTFCTLYLVGIICGLFTLIGFVCWIIYWVKIAGFNSTLKRAPDDRYDRGRLDDLDDDYRKPFRGRDRDRDDREDDYRKPPRDRDDRDEGYRPRRHEDDDYRDR